MKILLIRHAAAEERDDIRYPDDSLRPLTGKGRKRHHKVARFLVKAGIRLDHIISSPYTRALQTAQITAKEVAFTGPIERSDALADRFSVDRVLRLFLEYPSDCTLCLVGHEPSMGTLASALLTGSGSLHIWFKKSGVMIMNFEGNALSGQGELAGYIHPGLLP